MIPICGDLVTIACRAYGTYCNLRIQGVSETADPADAWCLATGSDGLVIYMACRPDPRHATLTVHETNWALRVLAICYAIARAVVEEANRIAEIRATAALARLEWSDTIVEEQEGAA